MNLPHAHETMDQVQSLFTRLFSNVEHLPVEYRDLLVSDLEQLDDRFDFLRQCLDDCHEEAVAPVLREKNQAALADVVNEKNRLLAVMEALPIAVAILDEEGGMVMANRGFDQIWSGPRPVPKNISDYAVYKAWWGDSGLPVQVEEWASARAVLYGETVTGQFMQIQQFDGNRAYVLNSGAPVRDAQGKVVGSAVALVDITERIQVENTLRENERNLKESDERFRVALSTLPVTVFKQDHELRYIWMYNHRLGWNLKDILGKGDDALYPREACAELTAVKQTAIASGEGLQREIKIFVDGQWKYYLLSLDPQIDPSGKVTGLIGASLDVTEQRFFEIEHREAVTQMEVQRRLLEYREKERQLIARDLHDGPVQDLSSLLFNIQFAREVITDPGLNVELEQIGLGLKTTIQNLRGMINELRPPSLIRFGLAKSLQVYLENFREKHPEIILEVVLMDEGGCLSEQARLNLYRIAQEALNNAINHADVTRIEVQFSCNQHEVVLSIQDDGKGFIVPDNLVDFPIHGHFGLVGMKERSEAIGGSFRISSQIQEGTTIEVTVPMRDLD